MSFEDEYFTPNAKSELYDAWLLPLGKDSLSAKGDDLLAITVAAASASSVRFHDDVRRQTRHYVLDVVVHGTNSPAVMAIRARARTAADRAGRLEWERGETTDLIRSVVGSRSCG